MSEKDSALWKAIYFNCCHSLGDLDLLLDNLETLIDLCSENREEFPVGFDEFRFDLERSIKYLTELKEIAKERK